jgi:hypothetical protein
MARSAKSFIKITSMEAAIGSKEIQRNQAFIVIEQR